LLIANRLPELAVINNDILSKNVLYHLGNFSPEDTKYVIESLTERSQLNLEPALVDELVQELASELGEVRPIELQVVGTQMQTEGITTLAKYQELGTKEQLVKRYLEEVIRDCGAENEQAAQLLLYLLTDENNTRPIKTRADLEVGLKEWTADLTTQVNKLDLVLKIFVESGLVLLLPEVPTNSYQLVHDYLVSFIRQQQDTDFISQLQESEERFKRSEQKLNRLLHCALVGSGAAATILALAICWMLN
ncbi:MAG: hypothetical protein WA919_02700, partial [Coleofasciculaceae cyanobacterium]